MMVLENIVKLREKLLYIKMYFVLYKYINNIFNIESVTNFIIMFKKYNHNLQNYVF
jgi:hypothetical protein